MAELALNNVSFASGGADLIKNTTMNLGAKELVVLVGPNGAGKTTLLKCALGLLKPDAGEVLINGAAMRDLTPIERARLVSYLPQSQDLAWPVTVRDVVALGRYAYGGSITAPKGADATAINRSISDCALTGLADRRFDTLSGGERARVHCARAFAGQAPILLADEPVAALDPAHQFNIMSLIRLFTDNGGGALVVLHDIALAARFADRLIWMKDGAIAADGAIRETLNAERLNDVFDIEASVTHDGAFAQVVVNGAL